MSGAQTGPSDMSGVLRSDHAQVSVCRMKRVPPNIFGSGFGLAGLATTWSIAVSSGLAPAWVRDALAIIAAAVWLAACVAYLRYALATRGALASDLRDMTFGPFLSLAVITPMPLATAGIQPYAHRTASDVVDVCIVVTLLLGAWFTGFWMRGGTELDRLHPGYFLPTAAGGLVSAASAAQVGQHRLGVVMLGLGLICWVILGSMILLRLIFRPPLPDALAPTMAIEIAPPAVASLAYIAISGGRIDAFASLLAGYGLLIALAQMPLMPRYARLKFGLATWSFTFSWASVASTLLLWIGFGHLTGGRVYSYLVLAAITILIGAIAARTVVAIQRRQLLPVVPAPEGRAS
jgi:tellurite resistance protein